MTQIPNKEARWRDYVYFRQEESRDFWGQFLNDTDRDILIILGRGFDPRMCAGPKLILDSRGIGKRDCLLLTYLEGADSPSLNYEKEVKRNRQEIENIINGRGNIIERSFNVWATGNRWVGSQLAAQQVGLQDIIGFTDIVVDISAMPRGIYFAVLGRILYLLDDLQMRQQKSTNLHLIVAEDVALDTAINEESTDKYASYVHGFAHDLQLFSESHLPTVWIPILGERKQDQLQKIYDLVRPDEICPVLPSPSRVPRRADNLISDYHEMLFHTFGIEHKNIIYACEWNPFETYLQIRKTILRYQEALEAVGGCRTVLSSTSSKLLSIGVFLAAYECKFELKDVRVAIANVESRGYTLKTRYNDRQIGPNHEIHSLWLSGECYDDES